MALTYAHLLQQSVGVDHLVAPELYDKCLHASPPPGGWFSIVDTITRLSLTFYAFYRFLVTRPFSLLYFAYGWNTLWYGRISGLLLTLCLPVLPFFLCGVELLKRVGEMMPWAEEDWKLKGPGRVFFVRPEAFLASIFWDFQLALASFCGSFLQFGTDRDGLMHTWYDTICNKEYWLALLDQVDARRPLQLASWDGKTAHAEGPGPEFGSADLVSKINDSYLGIGDRVLKRGKAAGGDFDTLADIQAILEADPEYAGKQAILCEFIVPTKTAKVCSEGFPFSSSLGLPWPPLLISPWPPLLILPWPRSARRASTPCTPSTSSRCAPRMASRSSTCCCGRTARSGRATRARRATWSTSPPRRSLRPSRGTRLTLRSRRPTWWACSCPACSTPARRPSLRTRPPSSAGSRRSAGTR